MRQNSRAFRSSFPEYEHSNFRTMSWKRGKATTPKELAPFHPTVLHAFAVAARLEDAVGISMLPDRAGRPTERRSYRELYHQARSIAGALVSLGIKPGDRVLLVLPTSFDFVVAFYGAQLVGAVPVPAYPPGGFKIEAGLKRLAHIANHSRSKICLTWKKLSPIIGDLGIRARKLRKIVNIEDLRDAAPLDRKFRVGPGELAFIQYTSGSTGNPKGVALTHANLVANVHAIGQALEVNRNDVYVGWCPLYHDMGLIGQLIFTAYWRMPCVLMSPLAFLAKPSRWLWAIHEHRGTLATAPNFGYALCTVRVTPQEREGLDLSTWRTALNGAEPVNYDTLRRFEQVYEPHGFSPRSWLPVYGLAEASLAVTFPQPGNPIRHDTVDRVQLAQGEAVPVDPGPGAMSIVSCGAAVPGHDVLVVDENNKQLPERQVGHILASGPSLMQGYFEDKNATREVMSNGWLWTGDLGYFADGHLYVAGRAKDLIIVRGVNYYAEDLERSAESVRGARGGSVIAFGLYDENTAADRVVIVVETKLLDADERAALAGGIDEAVTSHCGIQPDEVVLVEPGTVPKTSSGKRQRSLCRTLYLSKQLIKRKQGKLKLGMVFMRSQAGHLLMRLKGTGSHLKTD